MKKLIEQEEISQKYGQLEQEAYVQGKSEQEINATIRIRKEEELEELAQKYSELEKEQEAKLRIDMEERFSQEKKSLI